MSDKKPLFQTLWGAALLLAGLGVFYRTPQIMPKISEFETDSFELGFIRLCFYIMGVILVGGGIKKILANRKKILGRKD
ncbi:conserved hypothetical protein [Candidatus Desulfarcum epimagneticum]|uniref:Uncharacterized protein n=1 Tax=uncultured Desulfobacteraceae bacterium TaxID=218296 RepID=A0A484HFQ3_9BACT|nr:conserved hypothetical protein [uncultured Desulfobacteraceae bacterium]